MKRFIIALIISLSLTVGVQPSLASPNHLQDEIVYNIIIDRFNNGDQSLNEHIDVDDPYDYHGGDFAGITKRLDHINHLGFTTIVLSPVVKNAAKGFHGYWVEDFMQINENYGTEADLRDLINEAHRYDIDVVLELVTNYTAKTHPFLDDDQRKDWFKAVEYKHSPEEKSLFWLDDALQINQEQEGVLDYFIEVIDYWMDEFDIDGFKFHAADQANENFLKELSNYVKEKDPNFYLFAHVLDGEADLTALYDMDAIDAVENPSLSNKIADTFESVGATVEDLHQSFEQEAGGKDLIFTETKDTARFANKAVLNNRTPLTAWKLALTYLYTTPGVPYMYQGNELQMLGEEFPETQQMMRFNSTDPDLEEFHEKLSLMRSEIKALRLGDYAHVASKDGLSIFQRTYEGETIYVAINNDEVMHDIHLDNIPADKQLRGLFNDEIVRGNQEDEFIVTLPRESVEIYVVQDNFGINWFYIGFVALVFIVFLGAIFRLSRKQKQREQNN